MAPGPARRTLRRRPWSLPLRPDRQAWTHPLKTHARQQGRVLPAVARHLAVSLLSPTSPREERRATGVRAALVHEHQPPGVTIPASRSRLLCQPPKPARPPSRTPRARSQRSPSDLFFGSTPGALASGSPSLCSPRPWSPARETRVFLRAWRSGALGGRPPGTAWRPRRSSGASRATSSGRANDLRRPASRSV